MRPIVCGLLLAMLPVAASAQFSENFDDGDISWQGMDTAFQVYQGMLRSRYAQPNSLFYLSRPSTLATGAEWTFFVHLDFTTSSQNYADVYLLADTCHLLAPQLSGYFVRIGNTTHEVSLYRKPPGAAPVKLIDGRDGVSDKPLRIRVTRTTGGEWRLFTDGVQEGITKDTTYMSGRCFGLLSRQPTSGFFNRHYFDDIIVKPLEEDTIPPRILQMEAVSPREVLIRFSEPVESSAAEPERYWAEGYGQPQKVMWAKDQVRLFFDSPFPDGMAVRITVSGISDVWGNRMLRDEGIVLYHTPAPHEVLIHEILANPSTGRGLLEHEFVELRNVCPFAINLAGWTLRDTSKEIILPDYRLQPDSVVVICAKKAQSLYQPSLNTSAFLTLTKEGKLLSLHDPQGRTIHAVSYERAWYAGSVKGEGGWSLEMADTHWPCTGKENWKPSEAATGGTPGRHNSLKGGISEPLLPSMIRISVTDSTLLQLHFSGTLDSGAAAMPSHYITEGIHHVTAHPPLFHTVSLKLEQPLERGKIYGLQTRDITDCAGRPINQPEPVLFGLPEVADTMDVIIHEVLFDPPAGAEDFVEIFNRSRKTIDLNTLYFASRDVNNQLKQMVPLVKGPWLLLPGAYLAFTQDVPALCRQYACKGNLETIRTLPTLPESEGTIILLKADGRILDEVSYKKSWHSGILRSTKGISLEKLHPDLPSQQPASWHSAASTAGYATPGYVNSQQQPDAPEKAAFSVEPEVFSPDNDGQSDRVYIFWNLPDPGHIARITVYDAQGRPVRQLARNLLLGNKGNIYWDGLSDTREPSSPGIYVIFIQIFRPEGSVKTLKLPVVLIIRQ